MWMIGEIFLMVFLLPIMGFIAFASKAGKKDMLQKKREEAVNDDGFEWEIIRKPGKDK